MTSTVYSVNGGMEDWAYGAGFDHVLNAALDKCEPESYPLNDDFFE